MGIACYVRVKSANKLLHLAPPSNPVLFSTTEQDGMGAAPPISSQTQYDMPYRCKACRDHSPASNNLSNQSVSATTQHPGLMGSSKPLAPVENEKTHSTTEIASSSSFVAPVPEQLSVVWKKDSMVSDFLSRPERTITGTLTTTDTGAKSEGIFPYDALTILRLSKLSGYMLFKGTLHFKLETNPSTFQAGRYLLGWMPYEGAPANNTTLAFYQMHTFNATTYTQLPHVEIDLSTTTSVELIIPYSSVRDGWFTKQDLTSVAGRLFLAPYSALVAGSGVTSCTFTIWTWFTDIEVACPTVSWQSGIEDEQELNAIGPISAPLAHASRLASSLSWIPQLSPFAGPTAWFLRAASMAATSFGFSKPLSLKPTRTVNELKSGPTANSDTAMSAVVLSPFSTNSVNLSGNVDEMSIDFIKQQFAYVSRYTVSTSDAVGAVIATIDNDPGGFFTIVTPSNYLAFAPVALLARNHYWWRGDLLMRFKIVKSRFHAGRLLISWTPSTNLTAGGPIDINKTTYVQRLIVDISTTQEFTVKCPYTSPLPWTEQTQSTGYLTIFVLEKLVAPTEVSSSITLLMEVAASENFDFAQPIQERWEPAVPPVVFQSGLTPLGESKPGRHLTQTTIGEVSTSIRTLMKSDRWLIPVAPDGSTPIEPGPSPTHNAFYVRPYYNAINAWSGAATNRGLYRVDTISYWAVCYARQSGSIRLMISTDGSASKTNNLVRAFVLPTPPSSFVLSSKDSSGYGLLQYGTSDFNNLLSQRFDRDTDCMHVQIPNNNRTFGRPTASTLLFDRLLFPPLTSTADGVNPSTFVLLTRSAPTNTYIYSRSINEDYNMSMWLGTTSMVVNNGV